MTVHPVLPQLSVAEVSLICTVQLLGLPRTGTRLPGEWWRLGCAGRQSPSSPCAPRHKRIWVRHRNGRHECSLNESASVLGVDEIPDPCNREPHQRPRRGNTPSSRTRVSNPKMDGLI